MSWWQWILVGYAVLGLWTAVRIVPWGQRGYCVARYKSDAWHAKLVGGLVVLLVVAAFWPVYAWIWWREGQALELIEFLDAADAADAADEARDDFLRLADD